MINEKSTSNYLATEDTAIVNHNAQASLVGPSPSREPLDFHRRLPGYSRTPLVQAPELAAKLHVGQVWVKDESSRLGLPAFKILEHLGQSIKRSSNNEGDQCLLGIHLKISKEYSHL